MSTCQAKDSRFYQKQSSSNLLFQKLLRNYQILQPALKQKSKYKNHHSRAKDTRQQNEQKNQLKVIDLNKKMKIMKCRSADESNKENQSIKINQLNSKDFTNSLTQKSEGLWSNEDQEYDKNQMKVLDINQFILDCKQAMKIFEEDNKSQEKSQKSRNQLLSTQQIKVMNPTYQSQQMQKYSQNRQLQQELFQEELPEIPIPIKQLSKCEILDSRRQIIPIENYIDSANQAQQMENRQTTKDAQKEPKIENVHIKNKISLRILKKKLQTLSPHQVVAELVRHRQIQLKEGQLKGSKKEAVCEALLSMVKNQLIQ